MILSSIKSGINQVSNQNNKLLLSAIEIIKNTDFSKLNEDKNIIDEGIFYFILASYITKELADAALPESHKKFIDLHYIISGKEKIGYADLSNPKVISAKYDNEKDAEFYSYVANENFFIFKEGMFVFFYPEDIHRTGITVDKLESVRKIIFKIKLEI
jgi:YhcH/YjgK/YiaL family protein